MSEKPKITIASGPRQPARSCVTGGKMLDGATQLRPGHSPGPAEEMTPGSMTMCMYCKTIYIVTETGFRFAADHEVESLPAEFRAIYAALTTFTLPDDERIPFPDLLDDRAGWRPGSRRRH